jgi:hypothetical protein
MSIGANAIGELPIGAAVTVQASKGKPPKKRRITAKADVVQQPEAR